MTEELERRINAVDIVLSILREQCSAADGLENKLTVMKCQRHIEHIRFDLKRQLFAAIDREEQP